MYECCNFSTSLGHIIVGPFDYSLQKGSHLIATVAVKWYLLEILICFSLLTKILSIFLCIYALSF